MKKIGIILLALGLTFTTYAQKEAVKTKPIELTKAGFLEKVFNYEQNKDQWKYNGTKPAIVDFYATWCGPCKRTAPILTDLAAEYGEDIVIYKIDVDKEPELASVFGIQSIPTFIFIPQTGDPQIAQGALPKETFKRAIDEILLKKDEKTEL